MRCSAAIEGGGLDPAACYDGATQVGNVDPAVNSYFPANAIGPASKTFPGGWPLAAQTGWGGGVNVSLSAPSGQYVWGVYSTPSAAATPAGTSAALVTWFIGTAGTVPSTMQIATFGAPCAGACVGTLVNTARRAAVCCTASSSLILARRSHTSRFLLFFPHCSASGYVPVNLTASHVFTGLGSNTPTTAPICLRYIHPLVNGANLYRSPLICTATVRLAERCRVIIFY